MAIAPAENMPVHTNLSARALEARLSINPQDAPGGPLAERAAAGPARRGRCRDERPRTAVVLTSPMALPAGLVSRTVTLSARSALPGS